MSSMELSLPANSAHPPLVLILTSGKVARLTKRGLGIQGKILAIVAALAAVVLLATGLCVSGMRSYHDQVAAMTQASERALLGEQMDKLVMAVVMDSRGIYMSADPSEAEKFAPALLKSLNTLQQRTAEWLALAPIGAREQFADAARKVDEFVRFRKELVRLAREVDLKDARSFGDNDANRSKDLALIENCIPKILEYGAGHTRMANDTMRRAPQFTLLIAGNSTKDAIGLGDAPFYIGLRYDDFIGIEKYFRVCRSYSSGHDQHSITLPYGPKSAR